LEDSVDKKEYGRDRDRKAALPPKITKPMGYTQCMFEIYPTPIAMVKTKTNLVWAKRHKEVSRRHPHSQYDGQH
jgi:hypothetical protein